MRPKSFPSRLSIGTDIVSIARIAALLGKHGPARFARRIFGVRELEAWKERWGGVDLAREGARGELAGWFAGRFAAKEAAIKAHTRRRLTYRDVWIYKTPGEQAPVALIREEVAGLDGGWECPQVARVSISHDLGVGGLEGKREGEGWAVATCLAVDEVEGRGMSGVERIGTEDRKDEHSGV